MAGIRPSAAWESACRRASGTAASPDSATWEIALPADLAPGKYSVFTGLYRMSDGERLPASAPARWRRFCGFARAFGHIDNRARVNPVFSDLLILRSGGDAKAPTFEFKRADFKAANRLHATGAVILARRLISQASSKHPLI